MTHNIDVVYGRERRYGITVGLDIWQQFRRFCSGQYSPDKVFIAADSRVSGLHGEKIREECGKYFDTCIFTEIPEGESSKSISHWNKLTQFLLEEGIERTVPLLAVGGGVTGDLAGFAAATALRGVPLVHFPTSLLAMVDSSIGGKTGVNFPTGKNLIGSFYQPDAVFADVQFLETLDRSEWINGAAEIIKYGAISDPLIFEELESLLNEDLEPSGGWVDIIGKSASIKAEIVSDDTLETGKRAYLNFGHTFAHALEKVAGYGKISHGEAVFVGMIAALYASKMNGAPLNEARFAPFYSLYPLELGEFLGQMSELIKTMYADKKVKGGTIRLVLLKDWGNPYLSKCEDDSLLEESWKFALDKFN